MSTPVLVPGLFESWPFLKRRLQYGVVALVTLGAAGAHLALSDEEAIRLQFSAAFLLLPWQPGLDLDSRPR